MDDNAEMVALFLDTHAKSNNGTVTGAAFEKAAALVRSQCTENRDLKSAFDDRCRVIEMQLEDKEILSDKNSRLQSAIDWVISDAAYKAPEQMNEVCENWLDRLSAVSSRQECKHEWGINHSAGVRMPQCKHCGERP